MKETLNDNKQSEKLMLFYERFLKEILNQEKKEDIFKTAEKFSNFLVDKEYEKDLFDFQNFIFDQFRDSLIKIPFELAYKRHYTKLTNSDSFSNATILEENFF